MFFDNLKNIIEIYTLVLTRSPGDSGMNYWTMTPAVFDDDSAGVWYEYGGLYADRVDRAGAARPVINVTTDNGFTSGDGTALSPYVIS